MLTDRFNRLAEERREADRAAMRRPTRTLPGAPVWVQRAQRAELYGPRVAGKDMTRAA